MTRSSKQLTIDGVGVDVAKARFGSTFEVALADEKYLAFDEEVVYVVVARVSTPAFRESKNGDVSRVDVLKVKEARLIRNEAQKKQVLESIGFEYVPQPSMFDNEEEGPTELVDVDGWNPTLEVEDDGNIWILESADAEAKIEAIPTPTEPEWLDDDEDDDEPYEDPEDAEYVGSVGPGGGRVVARAQGAAAHDPVLAKFLNS